MREQRVRDGNKARKVEVWEGGIGGVLQDLSVGKRDDRERAHKRRRGLGPQLSPCGAAAAAVTRIAAPRHRRKLSPSPTHSTTLLPASTDGSDGGYWRYGEAGDVPMEVLWT